MIADELDGTEASRIAGTHQHRRDRGGPAAIIVPLIAVAGTLVGVTLGNWLQSSTLREQADLVDVRVVFDQTAVDLTSATREIKILGDRCQTKIDPGEGSPAAADQAWRLETPHTRPPLNNLQVDIQRIRIRLASPTIPDLFAKVVDALEAARAPCVTSPLEPDAGTRTAAGLETADKLALAYYAKVASSVGARIPD